MGSPSWGASKTRRPIFCSSQRGGRLQHQLSPTHPPHALHPCLPFGWVGKVFPFPKPTRKDQNTPGREPHFSLQLTSSLSVNTSEGLAGSQRRVLSGAWRGVSGLRKAGECSWQFIFPWLCSMLSGASLSCSLWHQCPAPWEPEVLVLGSLR